MSSDEVFTLEILFLFVLFLTHAWVKISLLTVPHVVFVVGRVCFDDPWGYAVEPLVPDRSKMRLQTKRDTGVYAVCGRPSFASGTRLLISRACTSEPETT